MNLQEIKAAIEQGKKVYWSNTMYEVVKNSKNGELLIQCGSHCIGLTRADEKTLNGKEVDFFINEKSNA